LPCRQQARELMVRTVSAASMMITEQEWGVAPDLGLLVEKERRLGDLGDMQASHNFVLKPEVRKEVV